MYAYRNKCPKTKKPLGVYRQFSPSYYTGLTLTPCWYMIWTSYFKTIIAFAAICKTYFLCVRCTCAAHKTNGGKYYYCKNEITTTQSITARAEYINTHFTFVNFSFILLNSFIPPRTI